MNFLELVQETMNDAGTGTPESVSGGLAAVRGGYAGVAKRAVQEAWLSIQSSEDSWTWMQHVVEIPIRDRVQRYPMETLTFPRPFGLWRWVDLGDGRRPLVNTGRSLAWLYVDRAPGTGRGSGYVSYIPYQMFAAQYLYPLDDTPSRNILGITTDPANNDVLVGPTPDRGGLEDGSAVLYASYKAASQRLMEDEDVPVGLPERFHPAIKWRAILSLQTFDEARDSAIAAEARLSEFMQDLRREFLPRVFLGDTVGV